MEGGITPFLYILLIFLYTTGLTAWGNNYPRLPQNGVIAKIENVNVKIAQTGQTTLSNHY